MRPAKTSISLDVCKGPTKTLIRLRYAQADLSLCWEQTHVISLALLCSCTSMKTKVLLECSYAMMVVFLRCRKFLKIARTYFLCIHHVHCWLTICSEHAVPRKTGWLAEKLFDSLWYQIHGEAVPDGLRGHSHRPFMCAMDVF